jgi:RNA polymerase sigma-70 factor (ECF subfamily)
MPNCKRYHKNEEDARSVFNNGFLKILKNLSSVEVETILFAAWAKRIMANTIIDEYRKNKNYNETISNRDNERELDYHGRSSNNQALSDFAEEDIMDLLDYLKPATKQVFVMYVIEGYNHREISELLEMSEGTSKWHLSFARKELKKLLLELEEAELRLKVI